MGSTSLSINDLNYHFEKMSGVSLEVVKTADPAEIAKPAIVLGTLCSKLGVVVPATRWKEGFRFLVKEDLVQISGETPQATSYGIYTLLGKLGCDWVLPGSQGEVIPRQQSVVIATGDLSSQPSFGARRMTYAGNRDQIGVQPAEDFVVWKRRQRLGASPDLESTGQGHYSEQLIARYKKEFEAHPDMYALVPGPDGKLIHKKGHQLETTNPKVLDLIVRDIERIFHERKWPKDMAVTLPIGPGDGGGFSVSTEAQAIKSGLKEPILGGDDVTDLVVKLANDVIERIGSEYPNISFGFYIYSVHSAYPEKVAPNARIYPIFAPISYSRLHSTVDPRSKTRAYYRSVVDRWVALSKKQGNRLMVYEYNYNLADAALPFTRIRMTGEDLPFYHERGIAGFDIECVRSWGITAPHDYVFARMSWDVSLEWKALLKEFCAKAYGPAASSMERYYLRLAEIQSSAGQETGSFFSAPLIFNAAYVEEAGKDFKEALAQSLDGAQRERVQAARMPFECLRLYLAWNTALENFKFAEAKAAYDKILANWQQQIDVNPSYATFYVPRFVKGLMSKSTEQGLQYSSTPYNIAYRLPEELPTAFDPTDSGDRLNFQGREINDAQWPKTHTYKSTWDSQGIFYRDTVWYRVRFKLPAEAKGQPVGLFLGGFEDVANVWINGKPAGSSGRKFAAPAVFDLSDGIDFEAENVVAIQVRRTFNMWELGTGGLFRPSFIFTGPKVETAQPPQAEERVLPGGIREPAVN